MQRLVVLVLVILATGCTQAKTEKDVTSLQIGVKFRPKECDKRSKVGDTLKMHYTGKLTDGSVFDSSVERGTPFSFKLGAGQVIKGWDQGLLNMCIGEKRKLKIPADMGYGEHGSPPKIPGGATLIFETELIDIEAGGAAPAPYEVHPSGDDYY